MRFFVYYGWQEGSVLGDDHSAASGLEEFETLGEAHVRADQITGGGHEAVILHGTRHQVLLPARPRHSHV